MMEWQSHSNRQHLSSQVAQELQRMHADDLRDLPRDPELPGLYYKLCAVLQLCCCKRWSYSLRMSRFHTASWSVVHAFFALACHRAYWQSRYTMLGAPTEKQHVAVECHLCLIMYICIGLKVSLLLKVWLDKAFFLSSTFHWHFCGC